MILCWHKFPKWSEPEKENWTAQHIMLGTLVGDRFRMTRWRQERTCSKCGKYEVRYTEEE